MTSAALCSVTFVTLGDSICAGRSAFALSTALRTSFKASSLSFSSLKDTLIETVPSVIVVVMWSR
ncbi:hypothetical protein ABIA16_000653 [Sinorhizobium fredii]